MRRPSSRLADGELTHIDRSPVDVDLAMLQWAEYVDAFTSRGWDVIEVPELDDHPDGVFIEDNVFVFGGAAVIARSGADSRRGEVDGLADRMAELSFEVSTIEDPGTLDGGDLLKVGSTVYCGLGDRTNEAAVEQLRRALEPQGATVIGVAVTKALHLKSVVTALPDGTFVADESLLDDPDVFAPLHLMPEESGAHVVDLGDGAVLMATSCPSSASRVAALGFEPVTVDISEFEKLEGCVTCLSVRLR